MKKFDINDPEIIQRLVAENNHAFAFLNKMPILPGHTLICPKQSIAKSEDLTPAMWSDIFELKEVVCAKLKTVLSAEGFNFAWNEETVAGQTVPHFHLHIVPRKEGDAGIAQYEPRVFLYRTGTRAESPIEELKILAHELKKADL